MRLFLLKFMRSATAFLIMMNGQPMTLAEHIDDIREMLRNEQYPNEDAISRGVVLRILCDGLGWPGYDTRVVYGQYPLEGGRVDFALCHPEQKPKVLIEVKGVGKIEGGEQQLFRYAFHRGVPIIVLTDGQKWRFFYPLAPGDYREREVVELNLIEDSSEKVARCLTRYLLCESVRNGEAFETIREDHQETSKQRQAAKHLPEAWTKLIEEENESLLDALSNKTESLCGHKPTKEQIMVFLERLETTPSSGIEPVKPAPPSNISPSREPEEKRKKPKPPTRLVVTMPDGSKISHKHATETFADAIDGLGIEKVESLNIRLADQPLISTSVPSTKHHKRRGEHYIVHHCNTNSKKQILEEIAAELGESIQVEIVEK